MNQNRIFGQNLSYYMKRKEASIGDLAKMLGYDDNDIRRIIDARMYVGDSEKKAIANAIGETVESLSIEQSDVPFGEMGFMECRGEFSNKESMNEILDRFDAYCDIQEMLS